MKRNNDKIITAGVAVLTAALCLSLAATFTSCNKSVGVIGGADGPTQIIVSDGEKTDGETTVNTDSKDGKDDAIITPADDGKKNTGADTKTDNVTENNGNVTDKSGSKLSEDGIYTFANGETVEVPKGVSMYVGTVTEGTMDTVSVKDPSGEVYTYARTDDNYANDGSGLLIGDKATVYYEKDISEALFIVTEHDPLANIDPSWNSMKGKVKDAAMNTVTVELSDGTTLDVERTPELCGSDGKGMTIGDVATVYYTGDPADKKSFTVKYVYTEKGPDSLGNE